MAGHSEISPTTINASAFVPSFEIVAPSILNSKPTGHCERILDISAIIPKRLAFIPFE